jgi:hypothetical protein
MTGTFNIPLQGKTLARATGQGSDYMTCCAGSFSRAQLGMVHRLGRVIELKKHLKV